MKRRFEKGRAWWEVEVIGNVVHMRSSTGEERKVCATAKLAEAEAEKRAWDKRALGYSEGGGVGAVPAPAAKASSKKKTEPAPDAATKTVIRRAEGDIVFTYLRNGKGLITIVGTQRVTQVFETEADAEEHLARVLSLRGRDGYRVTEKGIASEEDLKEPEADDKTVEVRPNERGLWQLTFKSGLTEISHVACAFAISEMQRSSPRVVHVRCDLESPGVRWSEAIAGKTFPSIEGFAFDTEFLTVTRQYANRLGDLSATFAALPNLKRAFFSGDLSSTKGLSSAHLETLVVQGNPLSAGFIEALGNASLPKLEKLAIGLASEASFEGSAADVAKAISRTSAREVFVDGLHDLSPFLRALGEYGLPATLRRLMLGGGSSTREDELIAAFEAHAGAFANISIALSIEDLLSEKAEARMRTRLPTLTDLEDAREQLLPQAYLSWGEA